MFLQSSAWIHGRTETRSHSGVDKYEEFLKQIGCPVRFSEVDIDSTHFGEFADTAIKFTPDENGNLPGRPALSRQDIVDILTSAL